MKAIIAIVIFAATSVTADTYLSGNQVFCNCGAAENTFYNNFLQAEGNCGNYPSGGGYGSCLAVQLGFLSEDCRTQNQDAIMAALAGHEGYYEACLVESFPASYDASQGWQWPGAYGYAAMDSAFESLLQCFKTLMIGVIYIF